MLASELPAAPTAGQGQLPGSSPQIVDACAVEAGELPARPRPAPGRSRLPDGSQQGADDGGVEAGELPASSIVRQQRVYLPVPPVVPSIWPWG
jgi:hypothetical protein